ncbi:hypothetical protein MNBD_GAMMA08-1120 [hydrothermal vent metagenome]|uniref:Glutaredoxin domain-containing protein n=1 Tax=hydrothermal vent metagenome TaxID=652676 RepID=A0A3B0WVC9_9ZZZZ
MNTKKTKTAFYQQPIIIIFALFIAGFFLVKNFSQPMLSDEPLVLTKANPEIIMYGTQSCHYCVLVKDFFKKHNLNYIEYDIDTSAKNMEMFRILGGRGTPLVIINNEIIHGFNEQLMRDAL